MEYKNSFLDQKNTKRFNENILVGNWNEDRYTNHKPSTECPKVLSEFEANYKCHNTNLADTVIKTNTQAFRNKLANSRSHVKILSNPEYLDNMTTTTDIAYRIFTKRDPCTGKFLPNGESNFNVPENLQNRVDSFIKSYGNATRMGSRMWHQMEIEKNEHYVYNVSETKESFPCIPPQPRTAPFKPTTKSRIF